MNQTYGTHCMCIKFSWTAQNGYDTFVTRIYLKNNACHIVFDLCKILISAGLSMTQIERKMNNNRLWCFT